MNWLALLEQSLHHHSLAVVGVAFMCGLLSSFLPCVMSMMPILVGYIGGFGQDSKRQVFAQTLCFILGVATVLTTLGLLASLLGMTFAGVMGPWWFAVLGGVAIAMGLMLLDVYQLPLPHIIQRMPETPLGRYGGAYIIGVSFGLVTSPCGTPFLATILGFISHERNLTLGAVSLFAYAVGQGMILMLAGLFTGLIKHVATMKRVGNIITRLSGYLFLFMGVMLLAEAAGLLRPVLKALHLF